MSGSMSAIGGESGHSVSALAQPMMLGAYVTDLANAESVDDKERAAAVFGNYVRSVFREQDGEYLAAFTQALDEHVYDLMTGDMGARKGAILAIGELVDLNTGDKAQRAVKYVHYLRSCIPSPDAELMELGARTLGTVLRRGQNVQLSTDLITDFEVGRALEWLQEKREVTRVHGAAFLLRELSRAVPTLFAKHIPRYVGAIWVAVRDPKSSIREAAIESLASAMEIIRRRSAVSRERYYTQCVAETRKGLEDKVSNAIHGSLLAVGVLLSEAPEFMNPIFEELARSVLSLFSNKSTLVKLKVLEIVPVLAEFNRDVFVANFLMASMKHMLTVLKKEREKDTQLRAVIFLAVGRLAVAVDHDIAPWADAILEHVSVGLTKKRGRSISYEAITCVALMAQALGMAIREELSAIIDQMFSFGLSDELAKAMQVIARNVPDVAAVVRAKMMDLISLILSGVPYRHPGTPARVVTQCTIDLDGPNSGLREAVARNQTDETAIKLALQTLGTFDFRGYFLHDFLDKCVFDYLETGSPPVRQQAGLTVLSVLARQRRCTPRMVVHSILRHLLEVVVADANSAVRLAVLSALTDDLDEFTMQEENLRALFILMNDAAFETRRSAVEVVSRLSARNPAYVLPKMRTVLMTLLTKLEFSGDSRNKEESAQLLAALIDECPAIAKPYVGSVMRKVLPKLHDPDCNAVLASHLLQVTGALARVGGKGMVPFLPDLLPYLLEQLNDRSSVERRETALTTIGLLIEHSGHVVAPYFEYPSLLEQLFSLVKSAQSRSIRRNVIRVIGIIGALDPWEERKINSSNRGSSRAATVESLAEVLPPHIRGPSHADFYPRLTVMSVIRILREDTLAHLHKLAISTLMQMFQSLGLTKTAPFLPDFLPPLLTLIETCEPAYSETLFQNMGTLILIVKQHIRPYLPDIFRVIREHWAEALLPQILVVVEEISIALSDEFKVYLPQVLPRMLAVLQTDHSKDGMFRRKVLHTLETFGPTLDQFVDLVAEALVELFERDDVFSQVRLASLATLQNLCHKIDFTDHASRIIHALFTLMEGPSPTLRSAAAETLTVYAYKLGRNYVVFLPAAKAIMDRQRIHDDEHDILVKNSDLLENGHAVPLFKKTSLAGAAGAGGSGAGGQDSATIVHEAEKISVNPTVLRRAWDTTQISTKEDWFEWLRRLSFEMLKESATPALRACAPLAMQYPPLAMTLFNAGFVSCWSELSPEYREEIIGAFEAAIGDPTVPAEILQQLLNVAEFMDRDGKGLPIDVRRLGELAEQCHAYAKALHYKEIEYHANPNDTAVLESLIRINNALQDTAAAEGVLTITEDRQAQGLLELSNDQRSLWFEVLHRWPQALRAYENIQIRDPLNLDVYCGRMRCHRALGEWGALARLADDKWAALVSDTNRATVAPLAAAAAVNLGRWDKLNDYIGAIGIDSTDGCIYRALSAIHYNRFEDARTFVNMARDVLDSELAALIGESYTRAYQTVVMVQMLSEIEELIEYKAGSPDRAAVIREMWSARLDGMAKDVLVWQPILALRGIDANHSENLSSWLKYAALCRGSGKLEVARKTVVDLLGFDPAASAGGSDEAYAMLAQAHPSTSFSFLKTEWACGRREEALSSLRHIIPTIEDDNDLLGECYRAAADWILELAPGDDGAMDAALRDYKCAVEISPDSYPAWNKWAMLNYDLAGRCEEEGDPGMYGFVEAAMGGFFRAISLNPEANLQDMLRLLTLWFRHGSEPVVEAALARGLATVPIAMWLQVIPQLIARIDSPDEVVRTLIHRLLQRIGRDHPQALVFPLVVASKGTSLVRKEQADALLDMMREMWGQLVEEAHLVSTELIRISILWEELVYGVIEEASRNYFHTRNFDVMAQILHPVHQLMDKGPHTEVEAEFCHLFAKELREAQNLCKKFVVTKQPDDINRAWDYYLHVFKHLQGTFPKRTEFKLTATSPLLAACSNLELAIPGSYKAGEEMVTIASVEENVTIIMSSKRPRKVGMTGSDGKRHQYLLKGHEDLRQDERVMQLFGLVNQLLASDTAADARHLDIRRFEVIPLSSNSGLLSWVPRHDTVHSLVRQYRKMHGITLDLEHRLLMQVVGELANLDNLTIMQKIDAFEYACAHVEGNDLAQIMWLKSPSAEKWYERRLTYTHSLAVMSMVGYTLGLGDRHPSNIMIDRESGKVLHIDFGDCFEVAMHRDRYAETVPFRLTRMLVKAMEVSGPEGNFRGTSENVMRVLRSNKQSLMAVLEAFVYDPLLQWKIVGTGAEAGGPGGAAMGGGGDDGGAAGFSGGSAGASLTDVGGAAGDDTELAEARKNEKALAVIRRVSDKLQGTDFAPRKSCLGVRDEFDDDDEDAPLPPPAPEVVPLGVEAQVDRLIREAMDPARLASLYIGWCPFW